MKTTKKSLTVLIFIVLVLFTIFTTSCNENDQTRKNDTTKNGSVQQQKDTSDIVISNTTISRTDSTIVLIGEIGASDKWKSGWLDLDPPFAFGRGDTLIITVRGSARKVLIRLLPVGGDPDLPVGVIGNGNDVKNGEVIIGLQKDYPSIMQISVHGGEKPWSTYSLGNGNGDAKIINVTLKR